MSSSTSNVPPISIPASRSHASPALHSSSQLSNSSSFPSSSNLDQSTSPRQRRRIESEYPSNPLSSSSTHIQARPLPGISSDKDRKQMAYSFNLPTTTAATAVGTPNIPGQASNRIGGGAGGVLPKGHTAHTGQSTYTLSSSTNSAISPRPRSNTSNSTNTNAPGGAGEEGNGTRWGTASASPGSIAIDEENGNQTRQHGGNGEGPDSELADVIGQLSLNENEEVRYHGR